MDCKFGERLKELREERHLSQQQLAKQVGISDSAIGYWEQNKRIANIEAVMKLAFFGVSIDYLAGLED